MQPVSIVRPVPIAVILRGVGTVGAACVGKSVFVAADGAILDDGLTTGEAVGDLGAADVGLTTGEAVGGLGVAATGEAVDGLEAGAAILLL